MDIATKPVVDLEGGEDTPSDGTRLSTAVSEMLPDSLDERQFTPASKIV